MPASLSWPISSMISCRSTVGLLGRQRTAQLVVAGTIGYRLDRQGQRRRQIPVAERVAVAQRPGLSGQHRQVMPGVVGGLAASEAAGVLADDLAVTPDNDAIGIGAQLGSAPRRLNRDAVAVVVEAHQAALRHRDLDLVEAVERAR